MGNNQSDGGDLPPVEHNAKYLVNNVSSAIPASKFLDKQQNGQSMAHQSQAASQHHAHLYDTGGTNRRQASDPARDSMQTEPQQQYATQQQSAQKRQQSAQQQQQSIPDYHHPVTAAPPSITQPPPAQNYTHSPHLTMQGVDLHAHDTSAANDQQQGGLDESSMIDQPPPLMLDGERRDSTGGAATAYPTYLQKPIETVPTAFKWTHGSETDEVYLTGSFNNWQGKILMYKQEDSEMSITEYALIIDIPPGVHHYKYIVDGEWRLDEDAPTVVHNGVENNITEVKRPVFEYTPASYADSDDEDGDSQRGRAPYSQRAPLSSDYVQEPGRMPPHLSQSQVALNHTSSQDPTWLPIPSHVMINHLYTLDATEPNLLVTGITQRFKPNKQTRITHKFVTTVYYCPRPRSQHVMHFPSMNQSHHPNQLSLNIGQHTPVLSSAMNPAQRQQSIPQQYRSPAQQSTTQSMT